MAIAESGVNILASSTTTHRDGLVDMRFLFEIGEMEQTRRAACATCARSTASSRRARMLPGEATAKKREAHS